MILPLRWGAGPSGNGTDAMLVIGSDAHGFGRFWLGGPVGNAALSSGTGRGGSSRSPRDRSLRCHDDTHVAEQLRVPMQSSKLFQA
jgi:hypothetical protein